MGRINNFLKQEVRLYERRSYITNDMQGRRIVIHAKTPQGWKDALRVLCGRYYPKVLTLEEEENIDLKYFWFGTQGLDMDTFRARKDQRLSDFIGIDPLSKEERDKKRGTSTTYDPDWSAKAKKLTNELEYS